MSIKLGKMVYTADTGREFALDQMSSSHLLNVIAHHRRQYDTLKWILEKVHTDELANRKNDLANMMAMLISELAKRDHTQDNTHSREIDDYE